jgi:hypothetical protein
MLIKVLKTIQASKNKHGTECFTYEANNTYEIYDELAEIFIKENWGVKAIDDVQENNIETQEEKALNDLENKAIDDLENKSIKTRKNKNGVNKDAE